MRSSPSIGRRFRLLSVLGSGTALLAASLALLFFQLNEVRTGLVRRLETVADLIAFNSAAAIDFNDAEAAQTILGSLKTRPEVVSAGIVVNGRLFAGYPHKDIKVRERDLLPAPAGYRFTDQALTVVRPITIRGRRLGTLIIQSDLSEIAQTWRRFAAITGAVAIPALLIAILISELLQRAISRPILNLASLAETVSSEKDYSVRAPVVRSAAEIEQLVRTFNQMLSVIEEREEALRASNASLLEEVAERKRAEEKVHAQLARLELMHQTTRAIGERQDLPSIFQVVVRRLEDNLPLDFSCICLYDPADKVLTVASVGLRSEALAIELAMTNQSRIAIDENSLARCVSGRLVYEPDVRASSFPFPRRLARAGLFSVVFAPLLVESNVFGILIATRRREHGFSSAECEFLRQMSEHVALAAHQTELYNSLQRAYAELRETQQAVMQQERLRSLGQMASGIAHDINNAISPVALYTEYLLEREPNLSEKARGYLTTIARAVDDVTQTVSRMREFYRQREPQRPLTRVDLNRMIVQVADLTKARWSDMPQKRGVVVALQRDLAPALPAVMGMESEIREALTNLIFNAVDALPDGGTITVRTREIQATTDSATGQVAVEVTDTGVGMDEETRRRCLEPFFTTKGERGTGLGLAMVYGTLQRHGAEIEIDSSPGRGTTMRLLFAAAPRAPEGRAEVEVKVAAILPLRLLIVDDDPVLIRSLRDTLEADGHDVVVATGGKEGIEAFSAAHGGNRQFDVVITDLGMPYVDGRRVAESVKMSSPRTPVILLTGWGERLTAEGDIPSHVDKVLNKPPKLRELRAALAPYGRSLES